LKSNKESLINKLEQYQDNVRDLNALNGQQKIKFEQLKIELNDREQRLLNQLNEKEQKIYELNLNVTLLKDFSEEKNKLLQKKQEIQKQFEEVKKAQLQLREDENKFTELIHSEQQKLA